MQVEGRSLIVQTDAVAPVLFPIPGATPDGVTTTLVNVDADKGLVTTIIHIAPGASIPAHYHDEGSEAHYVLRGDFINAGETLGPGAFVTHPRGVVHGPHESRTGCSILTLQSAYVDPMNPDFHIAALSPTS
jgi:quercetin dioxygenase-like cupin family protein